MVSRPPSTSRVTVARPASIATFDANVAVDEGLQQFCDGQRLELDVSVDEDCTVGADRHRHAQRVLARLGAAADRDHFTDDAGFLQTYRLLDGDFVERIHAHLDIVEIDARRIGLDSDLDVVVDDAFDRDQCFHR